MASYKLIQDVEADDKLLGPLSFKQFVFALIAVFLLYISYLLYIHHAGFLDIITVPIAMGGIFLAFPFGKDQPTEIWAIAKLNFLFKPRRRIWTQSGVKELVTITVPKKIEVQRTDGLSQVEVRSRLQALADTIDSHGWAIKNVYQNPLQMNNDNDRLISVSSQPRSVPEYEVIPSDDLFDSGVNPIARQFDDLLQVNSAAHRQHIMDSLNKTRSDLTSTPIVNGPIITPSLDSSLPEEQLVKKLKDAHQTNQIPLNNMHALRQKVAAAKNNSSSNTTTAQNTPQSEPNPVTINLSKDNDKNIDVLSREADRALGTSSEEVEISLH